MAKRKHKQSGSSSDPPLTRREKGRKPFIFAGIIVAFIVVIVGWQFVSRQSGPKPLTRLTQFKHHGDLAFVSPAGDTVKTIEIEIVDDMQEIQAGLMYRKHLTDDQGMLFVMPIMEIQTFWMKNTPISLDMIFAKSDGEIATIHPRTTPYSLESVQSVVPTKYVLEVRGGFAEEYGVFEGQRIEFTRLDSAGVTSP